MADQQEKYPNVPAHARPKPKPASKGANGLTNQIIEMLKEKFGIVARRCNNMGVYREGETLEKGNFYEIKTKGRYTKPGTIKGYEDIDAIKLIQISKFKWNYLSRRWEPELPVSIGLKIAIEVKYGGDTQSPAQKKRQAEIESSGGVYIIGRSVNQVENELREKLKKYE
jgi:hypothetical protein